MADTYLIYAQGKTSSLIVEGRGGSVIVPNPGKSVISVSPGVGKENIVIAVVPGPPGPTGPRGAATLAIAASLSRIQIPMLAGVVDYILPALPGGSVLAFMNGIEVSVSVTGVNTHLEDVTPGEIDDLDILTVYY